MLHHGNHALFSSDLKCGLCEEANTVASDFKEKNNITHNPTGSEQDL